MARLTAQEQDDLLDVLNVIYGQQNQFESVKGNFNDETVELTEKALEELVTCNENMKNLITELVGGAAKLSRGWLKWSLKTLSWKIKDQKLKFDGAACKSRVAANYRSSIYISAM